MFFRILSDGKEWLSTTDIVVEAIIHVVWHRNGDCGIILNDGRGPIFLRGDVAKAFKIMWERNAHVPDICSFLVNRDKKTEADQNVLEAAKAAVQELASKSGAQLEQHKP